MFHELAFYQDFAKGLAENYSEAKPAAITFDKSAHGQLTNGWGGSFSGEGNVIKAVTFGQTMAKDYPEIMKRNSVMSQIKSFVETHMKLGTTDITSLLLSSISPRMSYLRNEETQILNLTDSATGPDLIVTDWVYRITERRQGTTRRAAQVGPEAPLPTTTVSTIRTQKMNNLAFWGDAVSVEFIADAQAEQQQSIDLLRQELDAEGIAIRQAINYDLWNGQMQTSFAPPNIPVMGGLVQRIKTNTVGCGAAGLSIAEIEAANDAIALYTGYKGLQKVIYCSPANVGAVRTLEINRYGGNNPVAFMQMNKTLATRFAEFNIEPDRIYEPNIGNPIPVIHDKDIPAGLAFMLTINPDYVPRMAYFRMGGVMGPWTFIRPTFDLRTTVFCMTGGTMDDPMEELRYAFTNTL